VHVRYPIVANLHKELANVFVSGPRVLTGEYSEFGYPKTHGIRYSVEKNPVEVSDKSWLSPSALTRTP
jgi:hypothetical protein